MHRITKKERLGHFAGSLGLWPMMGAVRSSLVQDLRVLAYHRVLPTFNESTFSFDTELISANQSDFDWQMAYVARHFEPVSCQQVVNAIEGGKPLPKRAMMVTFDDGYLDNYEVAFPILKKQGVPALFFVSTGYVGTDEIFWFDQLVYCLLHTQVAHFELDALNQTITPGPNRIERIAKAHQLLRLIKYLPNTQRLEVLEQIKTRSQVTLLPEHRIQAQAMTWAHIQEMAKAGMEFGSHSVTHPILATIHDPQKLSFELEQSKSDLEAHLGQPILSIAYPVGNFNALNNQVLKATQQAGYRLGFTYQKGLNKLKDPDDWRFLIKRIHVERYTTRHMFAAALELPEVFAI
jgi:peptidoglycan/xylan/chitin deacetylase (PgdA/CDA1 family)